MKKYLLPIMALALTFSFVACGDDEDEVKPAQQETQAPKTNYLFSFDKKTYPLADEAEITLSLLNAKDASSVVAEEDIKVTLKAGENSTAQAADYEFPAEVTILKGKNAVSFKVKAKNEEPEAESNTFILVPTFPGDNFTAGQFATAKVVLVGTFAKELLGTWVMNSLVTDKEAMDATWGGMATYENGYPAFNAEDELTIDATLVPSFKSDFKNFFIGEATYEGAGTFDGVRVGMQKINLSVIKVTGVNRYFSATEQSEDKVAYIGVRNIEDEETHETLLDVYLIDYESHSFAPEMLEYEGMYAPFDEDHPYVAAMTGMYINFTMKKKPVAAE